MGKIDKKREILKGLFGSNIRIELIDFFLRYPDKKFYQAEIAFKIRVSRASLQYELDKLTKIGFLKSWSGRYYRFYSGNKNFPFLKELNKIFQKY